MKEDYRMGGKGARGGKSDMVRRGAAWHGTAWDCDIRMLYFKCSGWILSGASLMDDWDNFVSTREPEWVATVDEVERMDRRMISLVTGSSVHIRDRFSTSPVFEILLQTTADIHDSSCLDDTQPKSQILP